MLFFLLFGKGHEMCIDFGGLAHFGWSNSDQKQRC